MGRGLLPALKFLVHDLALLEEGQVGGEVVELLALGGLVGDSHLEDRECVQHIELRQVEGRVVVDGDRVLEDDEVEPAAAALAAGADTPLAANLLQLGAGLAEVLGLEDALADARGVGLDDADDAVDLGGVEGQAGDDAAETGVAAGDVGVGAVVNVQHEGVGTLDEDLLIVVLGLLHELDGVDAVGRKLLAVLLEARNLVLDVVLEQVAEALLVSAGELAQLALEGGLVEDFVDADTTAGGLGAVRGANAAAGGANLARAELSRVSGIPWWRALCSPRLPRGRRRRRGGQS